MSYPREIRVLIVEDDQASKDYYDEIFLVELPSESTEASYGRRYPPIDHRFAFSYEDALAQLRSHEIFHLVILDLCLPEQSGQPAHEGVDWGIRLVEECQGRDNYPIPGLIIITAHADQTEQSNLRTAIMKNFSYGELVIKGGGYLPEIAKAVDRILSYLDVGVHVRDGGGARYPTLSPREEDLLRRAALDRNAVGVDLSWWSADYRHPTGPYKYFLGWRKTLMGRFLLPKGSGKSRINFFKFAPIAEAGVAVGDARLLEHKLEHIKVGSHPVGGSRMLLVTEKTGRSEEPPIPLNEFIGHLTDDVHVQVSGIVRNIFEQLSALGGLRSEKRHLRDLLWPGFENRGHNEEQLRNISLRHGSSSEFEKLNRLTADPFELLREIRTGNKIVFLQERECVHGDLNPTNVAIDRVDAVARAYIFDASGIRKGPMIRDIAALEVTMLLHLPPHVQDSMVRACAAILYAGSICVPPEIINDYNGPKRAINTIRFIAELRRTVASGDQAQLYAVAVFDQALIQLGGLDWPSGNKIAHFDDAVLLAYAVAGWVRRTAAPLLEATQC